MSSIEETRLGKIYNVKFGICGYQDAMLGISFDLGGSGWGVMDSKSFWDASIIEVGEYTQWTEIDRTQAYDKIMRYISKLLAEAKVSSIDRLKGIPIEAKFDGNILVDWRILTEVL